MESDVDLLLSMGSLWEIAIKVSLKKLTLPTDYETFIPQQIECNGIEIRPITLDDLKVIATLPFHHRDPFDRLLIAQATFENVEIINADKKFDDYEVHRQW